MSTLSCAATPNARRALMVLSTVFSSIGLAAAPFESATAEEPEGVGNVGKPTVTEEIARVHIAAPIGQVSFGSATAEGGRRTYATRSIVAGSASIVSLSAVQPLTARPRADPMPGPVRTANAVITSNFGAVRFTTGGSLRTHAGVDLSAPTGSPVAAAYDGRVLSATWAGSYGLLVILDHGDRLQTRYAHLSRLMVVSGQQVRQGDLIGLVGSTGRSTGPHLHYEVRRNGVAVNPLAH